MMTKKLYYKDPLAAAYMEREFGVKSELTSVTKTVIPPVDEIKYVVDSDNYHIFEPQVGDLWAGKGEDARCCVWYMDEEHNVTKFKKDKGLRQRMKIYSRNNKPFFMPEVEDDG